jgi:amidase
MTTFITRFDDNGSTTPDAPRVAVKDLIDIAGVPTTAGSRAVEQTAAPAAADAACLAGTREAGARIVGKTNLHELAMLPLGTNPWFGTPQNPLDPALLPGGSSSGSAVAVATGDADVAFGSDTGGSVRIPAACCGITGLKTTYGRVPLDGVWPLAPSFDTIGPMATTVAGVVLGMQLLEPGFAAAATPARRIGRLRTTATPEIERAIDDALRAAELDVVVLDWDELAQGAEAWSPIYFAEIAAVDGQLVRAHPDAVGEDIAGMIGMSDAMAAGADDARRSLAAWRERLLALFDQVELLALPTMPILPPRIDSVTPDTFMQTVVSMTAYTSVFNGAGTPCTAQPVPIRGSSVPASLQLVGPLNGDELLVATAAVVEAAVR